MCLSTTNFRSVFNVGLFFIGEIPFRDEIRPCYNTTYQLLSPIFCFSEHPCSRNIRSLFTTALDLCVAI